ncbi:SCO family protein [Amaricoccus sp. HAR-UPW-R2A-40]|nr:SCO family protein [Amaricoccus sp. HAR-UPW-R2A-40]
MTRHLRLGLLAGVLAATCMAAWRTPQAESVTDRLGRGDYVLAATDGGTFTEEALKGRPSAVFFGFTRCPDICPTTLGDIAAWRDVLGPEADEIRFWFVTVDPERDTIDLMRKYVSWTPGVTGVAGTPEETAKAVAAFRVYVNKAPFGDGDYTIDHSALVMLFGRDGRFADAIRYQEPPQDAVAKLRLLLTGG